MSLNWKNISVSVQNQNKSIESKYIEIIKNSCGEVNPGEIMAIMGIPGCGKKTLLNTLYGKLSPDFLTKGEIYYQEKSRDINEWINIARLIDSTVTISEELSVIEALRYAAKFRFTNKIFLNEKKLFPKISYNNFIEKKVNYYIDELNLRGCFKDKIYKVDENEKNKIKIAIALMGDPKILFIEDLIYGLDTPSAIKIIQFLKVFAVENNAMIIFTTHKVSKEVFPMFDKFVFLSKGTTLYNTNINEIEDIVKNEGIEKRHDITYSELFLQMCYNYEKSKIISSDKFNTMSYQFGRKKNDSFINFSFDIYHILILMHRLYLTTIKNTWNLIKSIYVILILKYNFFATYVLYIHILNRYTDVLIYEFGLSPFLQDVFFLSDRIRTIIPFIKMLMTKIYVILTVYPVLFFSSAIFIDSYSVLKSEIASGLYSPTSVYISYSIFYGLILNLFNTLYLFVAKKILKNNIDYIFTIFTFSIPLLALFLGFLIGSLTNGKKLMYLIVIFIGTLISIPYEVGVIILGNELYRNKIKYLEHFIRGLTYILCFSPMFHLDSIIIYFVSDAAIKDFGDDVRFARMAGFYSVIKKWSREYINGIEMNLIGSFSLLSLSLSLVIILGIFSLNYKFMTSRRLDLERKK